MTEYRLISERPADVDVEAAFEWYEYQELRGGIRRALLRLFPYAVYFAIEGDVVVVVAVLHASRDPAEWQRLGG